MPTDRILLGVIGAPHGVRGEVRIKSFTEDPVAIGTYGPLVLEDGRLIEIETVRPAKEVVVARLKDVRDRDAAEALKNRRLYIDRANLPDTEDEDTFYHADLIGLPVEDTAGAPLGTVTAVTEFGAGDLLEIAPPGGGPTLFLPFTRAAVPLVDLPGRRIVADPPAGLLDAEAPPPQDADGEE